MKSACHRLVHYLRDSYRRSEALNHRDVVMKSNCLGMLGWLDGSSQVSFDNQYRTCRKMIGPLNTAPDVVASKQGGRDCVAYVGALFLTLPPVVLASLDASSPPLYTSPAYLVHVPNHSCFSAFPDALFLILS